MKLIRLSKSVIDTKEVEAVTRILLEDGYLGMGAEVAKFEAEIAAFLGIKPENVVCVNSGTAALHLAVESILEPNGEILVPSFTFLATYQAISAGRCIPVSCDVNADTLIIDLNDAEKRITDRTRAIMPVYYASNPACIDEIYAFAKQHKLRVIEDAAHAFGCFYKSRKIGSFGDIICFSFDGIKNITSGEGGAVISFDETVLSRVKDARLLSIEKDSDKRYKGERSWEFDVKRQGYRYHMSNIFAAIGRTQLAKFESEFAPKRKALLKKYKFLLQNNAYIKFQEQDNNADIIPHIFPVLVQNGKRDGLRSYLSKNNIQTGIHYKPNHLLSLYYKNGLKLPVTERIYDQIISLPLHPDLSMDDVDYIARIVNDYFDNDNDNDE
jgi:dTDP-4-amino-4,6-dideoxygalactose transaminase